MEAMMAKHWVDDDLGGLCWVYDRLESANSSGLRSNLVAGHCLTEKLLLECSGTLLSGFEIPLVLRLLNLARDTQDCDLEMLSVFLPVVYHLCLDSASDPLYFHRLL